MKRGVVPTGRFGVNVSDGVEPERPAPKDYRGIALKVVRDRATGDVLMAFDCNGKILFQASSVDHVIIDVPPTSLGGLDLVKTFELEAIGE